MYFTKQNNVDGIKSGKLYNLQQKSNVHSANAYATAHLITATIMLC